MAGSSRSGAAYSPVLKHMRDHEDHVRRRRYFGQPLIFWILLAVVSTVVVVTVALLVTHFVSGLSEQECFSLPGMSYTFADSSNYFGKKLFFAMTGGQSENVIFSPFSLSSLMMLVTAGAKGDMAAKLRLALRLPCSNNESTWLDAYKTADTLIREADADEELAFSIRSANRLYVSHEFDLTSDFLRLSADFFSTNTERVDFYRTEHVRQKINNWVHDQTNGKIPQLLNVGSVAPDAKMILVNAVYFKSAWMNPFDYNDTTELPFYLASGDAATVNMMHLEADLQSVDNLYLGAQLVKLPYVNDRFHMLIILPHQSASVLQLERPLIDIDIRKLVKGLDDSEPQRTMLKLPRFRIESDFSLNAGLRDIGLEDIFHPDRANLTGMTGKPGLSIDSIIQKAFIEVNEEGTEAAAATAIESKSMQLVEPEIAKEIIVDRPFFYILWDSLTKVNLFMGKVYQPELSSL